MKRIELALLATAASITPIYAEDLALIIANGDYQHTVDLENAEALLNTEEAFSAAGYETITLVDATKENLQNVFGELNDSAEDLDRLVVAFSGHIVSTSGDSYLTPTDLEEPTGRNISSNAVSIERLLALLEGYSGGAMLALGTGQNTGRFFSSGDMGFEDAEGLETGIGPVDIPQGVTLVEGNPKDVAIALSTQFLSGLSFAEATELAPDDVRVSGFTSKFIGLNSVAVDPDSALENAYWTIAQDADSEESFRAYLDKYPKGEFAGEALRRIEEIEEGKPKYSPEEQAERDLNLTRDERRDVQRNLTILGHDPRGVDGLFGPASRNAIGSWQRANFYDVSGFLDAGQIQKLREQGRIKAEELAREAERQAALERERDIAFWQQTGVTGREDDLRVYLKEYPDGVYSQEARSKLDQIEADKLAQASQVERADWAQVEGDDSVEAYQAYLNKYPNGLFKEAAEARIGELTQTDEDAEKIAAAQKTEQSLGLTGGAWRLIEGRLDQMKLEPGPVDGKVTEETRKAIRNYQKNSQLPVTGYLDRDTLSRLIIFIKL